MRSQTMAWTLFMWMFVMAGIAHAQNSGPGSPSPLVRAGFVPPGSDTRESQQRLAEQMAKQANLQRQARMKSDTEKLLKLAEELKDSVGKSNENILSIEVMKKANEIEKLAHSVKEKMRGPT